MTKFPVATAIRGGKEILGLTSDGQGNMVGGHGLDMINHRSVATLLAHPHTAFFDIDLAAQLYWTGRKDYYTLGKDFGPMRPPYPVIWFEWRLPKRVMVEGKWQGWGEGFGDARPHMAALAITQTHNTADYTIESLADDYQGYALKYPEYFTESRDGVRDKIIGPESLAELHSRLVSEKRDYLAVSVVCYMLNEPTGCAVYLPYGRQIGLDLDGTFNGYCMDLVPKGHVPDAVKAAAKEMADINPVWMALSLTNCRNVRTRKVGSVFTRSGREKRQGIPAIKYHTIELPGVTYSGSGKRTKAGEAIMAQHMARGHTKTYTAEKPLLGRHVGTYWWGWQIRGNPEHGTVVKDYTLGETG